VAVGEEINLPRQGQPADSWVSGAADGRRIAVLLVDGNDTLPTLLDDPSARVLDVSATDDAAEALLLVGRNGPDVVVVGSPQGRLDPVTLVEVLRRNEPELPVVVGVRPADGELAGRIAALEPAAVITYPFRSSNLVRLLRSLAPIERDPGIDDYAIDLGRLQIARAAPEIRLDGTRLILPQREYMLLRYLAENAGRVVQYVQIGEAVWGNPQAGATNTIAVHVTRLRRRLGGTPADHQWITTVRGVGYRLTIPPVPDQPPPMRSA
jgi:DNA-binding response OmpR family regulator